MKNKISSKTILIVVAIIVVVVIMYQNNKNRVDTNKDQNLGPGQNTGQNTNQNNNTNTAQTNNSSSTGAGVSSAPNYQILADQIYNAKGFFDDDEESVYNVFRQIDTQAEYNTLKTVFISKYPPSIYTSLLGSYGDLKSYLQTFLNTPELAVISSILGPKGVSFN